MTPVTNAIKFVVERTLAFVAVLLLAPLFLIIAIVIKLDSRGPVFFRQERVGKDQVLFRIFKFRTMHVGAYREGARLTLKRDPRITRIGAFLRWTKLDELPQLLNVLVGHMSFVGPRPEDPYFVENYTEEQKKVLTVRPGLIGPSQIEGRDEVELYPDDVDDTERYYIETILPDKLERDLRYVETATLGGDVSYLIGGAFSVLGSQFKASFFERVRPRLALLSVDMLLIVIAISVAAWLQYTTVLAGLDVAQDSGGEPGYGPEFRQVLYNRQYEYYVKALFTAVVTKPIVFIYFGLYQRSSRSLSRRDLGVVVRAVSVASALFVAVVVFFGWALRDFSRGVVLVDYLVLILLMCTVRLLLRQAMASREQKFGKQTHKVIVAGSGRGCEEIVRSLLEDPHSQFSPVGIIDVNPNRWGAMIHGVRVIGGVTDLPMQIKAQHVDLVLVSETDLASEYEQVIEVCETLGVECRLLKSHWHELSVQVAGSAETADEFSEVAEQAPR